MGSITNIYQARALAEARLILAASFPLNAPIWRRRIRHDWQTGLNRCFVIELLPTFELQVKDGKTGALICIGPAITERVRVQP